MRLAQRDKHGTGTIHWFFNPVEDQVQVMCAIIGPDGSPWPALVLPLVDQRVAEALRTRIQQAARPAAGDNHTSQATTHV